MSEPSQPAESQRRVVKIEVTKLFNQFNHVIELKPERVTVLHGPNGVGKTKLLEMVSWLLGTDEDLMKLAKVPFERLTLTFSDETTLEAIGGVAPVREAVMLRLQNGKIGLLDRGTWRRDSFANQYYVGITADLGREALELRYSTDSFLIPTQRLLASDQNQHDGETAGLLTPIQGNHELGKAGSNTVGRFRVYAIADQLMELVTDTRYEYFHRSIWIDASFPRRIITGRNNQSWDRQLVKQSLHQVELAGTRLMSLGLIEDFNERPLVQTEIESLDEVSCRILSVYAADAINKFQPFEKLALLIELLLGVMNSQLRHKQLRLDPKAGLVAEMKGGERLRLDELSAGEQHLLVLYGDLLLNMRRNTLVLIDEPELGWHVTWQKRFLDHLLKIAETAQIDVIVATHSPFILGSRLDLGVALADDEGSVDEAQD